MNSVLALAAAAALAAAGNGVDSREKPAPVTDRPMLAVDPAASYILVQTSIANPVMLIRRPSEAEIADYKDRRAQALAKARAKWTKAHTRWKDEVGRWDRASPSARTTLRPEEPVEPTVANLDFTPLDLENVLTIGPLNRLAKSNAANRSVYLHRVRPGRYAFYGPVTVAPNGAVAGTCVCMGTIEFEVGPGQIVDAGTMRLNYAELLAGKREGAKPRDEFDLPEGMTTIGWDPPVEGAPVDPRLNGYAITPAKLRPAGPFPNYYGVQIERLTAIPGVLAYDRDRMVDASGEGGGSNITP